VSVSVVSIDVVLYSIKLLGVSLQVCLLDRWRRILKHLIELVVVVVELLLLDFLDLVRVIRQTNKSTLANDTIPNRALLINYIVDKHKDWYLTNLKTMIDHIYGRIQSLTKSIFQFSSTI
jgi:hypothetical protein